jgi:hypothetical protein
MIFDYTRGKTDRIVNLNELSKYIYHDEDKISQYCEENSIDIDGEFKINNSNLKRFYRISAKFDGIELTAPRSSFREDMIDFIDGKVVINSPELVAKLRSEMNTNIDE